MLITDSGTLVRTPVKDVSQMGRNTQGVRLIRLSEEERLVEVERIENLSQDESQLIPMTILRSKSRLRMITHLTNSFRFLFV